METQMLGSIKPYRRQVIISTGKTDWPHDVTSDTGTLAAYLDTAASSAPKFHPHNGSGAHPNHAKSVPGLYDTAQTGKVTILNGSHHSLSDEPHQDTVLVLPDYKVVTEVNRTTEGATALWQNIVTPAVSRLGSGEGSQKSWVLPYACVILLCSHKKRDNRCAIAAPKLETGLTIALEREHWEVHTQIDDPRHISPALTAIEDLPGTPEERDAALLEQLKTHAAGDHKRALILKCSHIGGHKFAGNCIIYTPQGSSIWYGRVTPHHVEAVVRDTIIGGKVIPALLRGGLNLARPGKASLNDW